MRDLIRRPCTCLLCRHRHKVPSLRETAGVLAFATAWTCFLSLIYNGVIQP